MNMRNVKLLEKLRIGKGYSKMEVDGCLKPFLGFERRVFEFKAHSDSLQI